MISDTISKIQDIKLINYAIINVQMMRLITKTKKQFAINYQNLIMGIYYITKKNGSIISMIVPVIIKKQKLKIQL